MQTSYRFSAPGRTEISGNHTDHQHGCVLAAAVDLETTAEVTLRPDPIIRVASEGYAPVEIDLNDLSVHEAEKNTTAALVRGVAAAFVQRGCQLRGFSVVIHATENSIHREREILQQLLLDPPAGILVEGCKTALPSLSEYEIWQTDEEEFRACAEIVHSFAGAGA